LFTTIECVSSVVTSVIVPRGYGEREKRSGREVVIKKRNIIRTDCMEERRRGEGDERRE
jgi:hypothetical protein